MLTAFYFRVAKTCVGCAFWNFFKRRRSLKKTFTFFHCTFSKEQHQLKQLLFLFDFGLVVRKVKIYSLVK